MNFTAGEPADLLTALGSGSEAQASAVDPEFDYES